MRYLRVILFDIALLLLTIISSSLIGCTSDQKATTVLLPPAHVDNSTATVSPSTEASKDDKRVDSKAVKDPADIIADIEPSVVLIMSRKFSPLHYRERLSDYYPFKYQDVTLEFYPSLWMSMVYPSLWMSMVYPSLLHSVLHTPLPVWTFGTGFIVDKRGYIVTNYHVIESAETNYVFLSEGGETKIHRGKEYIASLIYKDEGKDLAIIKISPQNAPLAEAMLGDSTVVRKGENVLAIGFPSADYTHKDVIAFMKSMDVEAYSELSVIDKVALDKYYQLYEKAFRDFYPSGSAGATKGIISAIRRGDNDITEIQMDAAISPGNGGGPLVNNGAEVIGINTWKMKAAEGMGFAVAINEAKLLLNKATALTSPPLISGVYCDVLRSGMYQEMKDRYIDDPTFYPPCIIIKWRTDVPATSQVDYIWNPFERGDIFKMTETYRDCCVNYCSGNIDILNPGFGNCLQQCNKPELCATLLDKNLTLDHKVVLPDLGYLNGTYDFKIISNSTSGDKVVSDEYCFLWAGKPESQFVRSLKNEVLKCLKDQEKVCCPSP